MQNSVKVAIIGLGNIGSAIAENLNKTGRKFIVAGRDEAKTKEISQKWASAEVKSVKNAVKEAEIIIPAIYFQALGEFLSEFSQDLNGKIIIDPSNPIAPDENGGFEKIIGENESAGEILSSKLPKGAKLVKAFGSLGVASLLASAFDNPQKVLFYADCEGQNLAIEQLIKDAGFEPVRIGGLEKSIRIEVFGDLHEFGALGKVVTLEEAQSKI